jgi:hypothetical protein
MENAKLSFDVLGTGHHEASEICQEVLVLGARSQCEDLTSCELAKAVVNVTSNATAGGRNPGSKGGHHQSGENEMDRGAARKDDDCVGDLATLFGASCLLDFSEVSSTTLRHGSTFNNK